MAMIWQVIGTLTIIGGVFGAFFSNNVGSAIEYVGYAVVGSVVCFTIAHIINAIDEIRDHVVSSFDPGRSASAPSASTNDLQATARETSQPSASGYVAPPQKWTCSKCGYRNEPNRITCKDCGTQK